MAHNNPLIVTELERWLLGHSLRSLHFAVISKPDGDLEAYVSAFEMDNHNMFGTGEEVYSVTYPDCKTLLEALTSTLYAAERHTLEGGLS